MSNSAILEPTLPEVHNPSIGSLPGLEPGISVIVPVYNSEKSLSLLVDRLLPVLNQLELPYELILVDDCSRDHSWAVVERLVGQHSWIVGITLTRNYGQHN